MIKRSLGILVKSLFIKKYMPFGMVILQYSLKCSQRLWWDAYDSMFTVTILNKSQLCIWCQALHKILTTLYNQTLKKEIWDDSQLYTWTKCTTDSHLRFLFVTGIDNKGRDERGRGMRIIWKTRDRNIQYEMWGEWCYCMQRDEEQWGNKKKKQKQDREKRQVRNRDTEREQRDKWGIESTERRGTERQRE